MDLYLKALDERWKLLLDNTAKLTEEQFNHIPAVRFIP